MSKVRSVTLDAWEPELVKVMLELGNTVINRIYEANVDETVAKHATPQCSRSASDFANFVLIDACRPFSLRNRDLEIRVL